MNLVGWLRKQFPGEIEDWTEKDSLQFSWKGNGLETVPKKRRVLVPLARSVSMDLLIREIELGALRSSVPHKVSLLKQGVELSLNNSSGRSVEISSGKHQIS